MESGKKITRFLVWLGVVILQLIMTQVVTLLFSLLVPGMENFPQNHPALFVVILVSLIVALLFYPTLEPGNPFFFISMLTSIFGFHIPGWIEMNRTQS